MGQTRGQSYAVVVFSGPRSPTSARRTRSFDCWHVIVGVLRTTPRRGHAVVLGPAVFRHANRRHLDGVVHAGHRWHAGCAEVLADLTPPLRRLPELRRQVLGPVRGPAT